MAELINKKYRIIDGQLSYEAMKSYDPVYLAQKLKKLRTDREDYERIRKKKH